MARKAALPQRSKNYLALLHLAKRILEPVPRQYPDEWGAANRTYSETSGMPGPRDPKITGYLIPFARKIHDGTHRRVVAVTAAQSGKTEGLLDVAGSRLDQRPAPMLYVGPSQDFVTDQFEPRLMSLLDEAPKLAAKVMRGKAMKKTQKWIAGVKVRLGFAGSSTSLKSDSFALGLVDEYDEMLSNVKGQGDPLGLVEARGETYADFVTAITSTPGQGVVETEIDPINGLEMWAVGEQDQVESPIWRLWQAGTRHHFAWPCPHCAEYFIPRHKNLRYPKGSTPTQARQSAYLECPACGGVIEDHHKPAMVAAGVQIAPGQTVEDARAGVNEPESSTWSCWTSGLCSPFKTFGDRAEKYLQALETGEPDKIQTVMNANFGECYSLANGAAKQSHEAVAARASPYQAGDVPNEAIRLTMGVDVQTFSLYWSVRAWGARATSWNVQHGQLFGPTSEDAIWLDLADLMMQPFGGLLVETVGVDSGFRPGKPEAVPEHKVYEFARKYNWMVVPTKGKDVQNPPYNVSKIEVKPNGKRAGYSVELAWLSTDFFKSLFLSRLATPVGTLGAFYPHSQPDEDYCKQLVSEVRVIENGKPKWVQTSRHNHFFDCEAINEAMGYTLNVQRIPEGVNRGPVTEAAPPEAGDDSEPQEQAAPQQSGSLRNKFAKLGRGMNRR